MPIDTITHRINPTHLPPHLPLLLLLLLLLDTRHHRRLTRAPRLHSTSPQAFFTDEKRAGKVEQAAMLGGNLSLAALLTARWVESGHFPLSNMYESLLFLAWGITVRGEGSAGETETEDGECEVVRAPTTSYVCFILFLFRGGIHIIANPPPCGVRFVFEKQT